MIRCRKISPTWLRIRRTTVALALASLPLLPLPAAAQCDPEADPACAPRAPGAGPSSGSSGGFVRGALAIRAQLGVSKSDVSPVLPGLDDGLPGTLGVTVWPWPTGFVAFDLAWIGWSRSFPNENVSGLGSLLLDVSERVDLDTSAVGGGLRLGPPSSVRVRPYAAAGLAWVHHKAHLDGSFFLIPGTVGESASDDWTVYWGGGIDTRFGAWGMSVDYRRMDTSASFGDPFDVQNVELGGSTFYLGGSWWPGS
jgi:hypothetical protein